MIHRPVCFDSPDDLVSRRSPLLRPLSRDDCWLAGCFLSPPHPHPLVSFSFFSPSSAIFLLVVVVDVFCFYFAGASLLRYRWCRRGSFRTMCVSFDSTKRNEMRRGQKIMKIIIKKQWTENRLPSGKATPTPTALPPLCDVGRTLLYSIGETMLH